MLSKGEYRSSWPRAFCEIVWRIRFFRKASSINIYNKLIFLKNTNEQDCTELNILLKLVDIWFFYITLQTSLQLPTKLPNHEKNIAGGVVIKERKKNIKRIVWKDKPGKYSIWYIKRTWRRRTWQWEFADDKINWCNGIALFIHIYNAIYIHSYIFKGGFKVLKLHYFDKTFISLSSNPYFSLAILVLIWL